MLIVGYEADPEVFELALPPGLKPHPNNLVQMNMYQVPTAEQTSHLDSYTLTYLTVEVADHDSSAISAAEGISEYCICILYTETTCSRWS